MGARPIPFADMFFKMRDYMTEDVDPQSLASQKLYIRQSENKRLNDFRGRFRSQAGVVTLANKIAKAAD